MSDERYDRLYGLCKLIDEATRNLDWIKGYLLYISTGWLGDK